MKNIHEKFQQRVNFEQIHPIRIDFGLNMRQRKSFINDEDYFCRFTVPVIASSYPR